MGRGPGRATRLLTAGLVGGSLVLTSTVLGGGVSSASPDLADARAQAAALAAEIDALEIDVATAAEDYNAAADDLASVVTRMLTADDVATDIADAAYEQRRANTARVSALYRAGSELSLYATVLDGTTPNDVVSRMRAVQNIVGDDHAALLDANGQLAAAEAERDRLDALADQRRTLEVRAETAHDRVAELVSLRQARLDSVSAKVRELAEEERVRAREAAEAAAAAQLATAQQTPLPNGGIVGGDAPGNPYAAAAIAAATAQVGDRYVWAATGPDTFDCSGLMMWSYRQAGLSILRTSRQQWYSGPRIDVANLAPGDLLFWATNTADPGSIHHVAMYLGGGQMIEAPYTGALVRIVPIRFGTEYIGAARPGLRS
jgi:cell wall-associated NlpC family hydrolase/outer membrane murein-binding lipoprotein Lpp